ncbi:hypothetical protein [Neobacillus terrae]|uniref:hypothetical protein n=1 Tax=Neobacillus terrae TaxID=3034837 RepID=UPI00140CB69A|nr:hypothetical protein [Neobacillus terrae]NHM30858.1 hypothetical protein [Neobacillus terrae]
MKESFPYRAGLDKLIPVSEIPVLNRMRSLPQPQKRLLWKIIKITSKDGLAIYNGKLIDLKILLTQGLIEQNLLYRGKGISLFVLPGAQHLLRQLIRKIE